MKYIDTIFTSFYRLQYCIIDKYIFLMKILRKHFTITSHGMLHNFLLLVIFSSLFTKLSEIPFCIARLNSTSCNQFYYNFKG